VESFAGISSSTAREVGATLKGIVRETKDGYSLVTVGSGLTVWVKAEDLKLLSPHR